ncbi:MAG: NAD(P)-dependent oxidoreductase, partial [Verrucomicrobiae bacterium]|nr:NAD(P)-dependent oxidoreductase [Verrucomicrobiae bacterium]
MTDSTSLEGLSIGFVGLGNMGAPMARHLKDAGADVWVWNRSAGPAESAAALGMYRVESLPELGNRAGPGIIGINLTRTEVVEEVVFGTGGLAEGLVSGSLLIDFGTTGVPETRRFAALLAERDIAWVDAPVSGGQVGAEAGNLTIMAGGTAEAFARALPVLRVVGEKITHMGPSGSGQVTKLANQLIVAQTIDAVAQALTMAEKAGVDPGLVREALRGGFAESRILELHGDRMVRRDFAPGGRSELQLKDVRLMSELVDSLGLDFPTLRNSLARWIEFVETKGHGNLDHSGLWR